MPIKQSTSDDDLLKYLDEQIDGLDDRIIEAFDYLGLQCVNEARSGRKYTDRTGNLINSIGYLVVKNGVIVSGGGFEGKGSSGKQSGEAYAKREVAEFNRGIVLMVVAGMEYAGYVEAMGLDVLVSSELFAEKQLPNMMQKLGFKVL